jgi:UDP-galactopyranose mutase
MDKETKYLFGGRLTDYKYYDMHQVIASALHKSRKENIYNI